MRWGRIAAMVWEILRMTVTFHVVLVEPEIAPNTGTIARLCLACEASLHLVGRLGFRLDDRTLKRAGLDYWPHVDRHRHDDLQQCLTVIDRPTYYFSAHASQDYTAARFEPEAALVFGSETRGLPASIREAHPERCFRIPIRDPRVRSLNLATAAAIVLFEALRQQSGK